MGIDIDGFIEVRPWPTWPDLPHEIEWEAAVRLDRLYSNRDYDAFGCLFGVANHAGFRPVAADRGLPADASEQVRRAFPEHSQWRPVWEVMAALARLHGAGHCRLVVWFNR